MPRSGRVSFVIMVSGLVIQCIIPLDAGSGLFYNFDLMRTMKSIQRFFVFTSIATLPLSSLAANQLTVKAVNKLEFARPSQTLELSAKQLGPLGEKDLGKIHVKGAAG